MEESEALQRARKTLLFIESLSFIAKAVPDTYEVNACVLRFAFDEAVVTIRIKFDDEQSGAQMVITNMTTLPPEGREKGGKVTGRGFGGSALKKLLEWTHQYDIKTTQAVQVQDKSKSFWIKNGFVPLNNVTKDFNYVRTP